MGLPGAISTNQGPDILVTARLLDYLALPGATSDSQHPEVLVTARVLRLLGLPGLLLTTKFRKSCSQQGFGNVLELTGATYDN